MKKDSTKTIIVNCATNTSKVELKPNSGREKTSKDVCESIPVFWRAPIPLPKKIVDKLKINIVDALNRYFKLSLIENLIANAMIKKVNNTADITPSPTKYCWWPSRIKILIKSIVSNISLKDAVNAIKNKARPFSLPRERSTAVSNLCFNLELIF